MLRAGEGLLGSDASNSDQDGLRGGGQRGEGAPACTWSQKPKDDSGSLPKMEKTGAIRLKVKRIGLGAGALELHVVRGTSRESQSLGLGGARSGTC